MNLVEKLETNSSSNKLWISKHENKDTSHPVFLSNLRSGFATQNSLAQKAQRCKCSQV
jgi:hypothetical protein